MRVRVVLTRIGFFLFFLGGGLSLAGGPLWLALACFVGGTALLAAMLLRSPWRPTQGRDPEARQAEARLWSTLNHPRE